MRQRVAIARAFAIEPDILFLDEPFGALDALTRETLRQELAKLCAEAGGVTTVMITNNVDEAILLSDRIVPMTPGPRATLRPGIPVPLRASAPGLVRVEPRGAPRPDECRGGADRMLIPPLELTGLTKVFPTPSGPLVAVKDVNVQVQPGEFVCILGHSGCGKSTVLSIVAGLDEATYGGVIIDGAEVRGPGTDRAVVFQSPCLLPWLTARENVRAARRVASGREAPRAMPADHYLKLVGVADAGDELPAALSLGTQQCVSLARALSLEPQILLLDEPFAQLDSLTRFELQDVLLGVCDDPRRIVVMVTHDVDEALYVADRLVLMTDGPEATVGDVLRVPFPRPRSRKAVLEHPEYEACYRHVIDFLEHHVQQLRPSPLDDILAQRA